MTVVMLVVLLVLVDHGLGDVDRLACLLLQMPPGPLSLVCRCPPLWLGNFLWHIFWRGACIYVDAMVAVSTQPWYHSEHHEEGPCEVTGNCKGMCFLMSNQMEL